MAKPDELALGSSMTVAATADVSFVAFRLSFHAGRPDGDANKAPPAGLRARPTGSNL